MLKRLKTKTFSIESEPLPAHADPLEWEEAVEVEPSTDAGGTSSRGRLIGSLQVVLVLLLMAAAIYYSRAPATPTSAGGMSSPLVVDAAPLASVTVITPIAGVHQVTVTANGSVGVTTYVDLIPQVSGRISQLAPSLAVGGRFRAGETLAVVEQDEFLLKLRQAAADVEVQRANLQLQQAKSDAAVQNYALINPNRNVPALVALGPQIAQAQAQLQAAKSREDIAKLELQRTRFTLPFDGMITRSSAQLGQLVSNGKAFGQAYATDSVELVAPIAQSDLAQLAPVENLRVQVFIAGNQFEASIDRVGAELDPRSRFAKVYIPLSQTMLKNTDGADDLLKPGMFADLVIEGPAHANSLLLPEAALQGSGAIWVVRGGRLQDVQPTLLGRNADGIVVAGFDIGEGIVIGSIAGAQAGTPVSINTRQERQI
ncbi:MAG: efflux RND transporter periplasmic adaptor subunit [SAR116 cluster bacterium]|nr:MAG: efflux RND transporter periplasmic adaptor subunit [SAR116 cluster bacterium]